MEEMHKDADRTTGRTSRRLSKPEDPDCENSTWEAGSSEERQTSLSREEEREPDKRSETPKSSTSILTAETFLSTGSRPTNCPLPEYGKQRGESDDADTTPKDPRLVDKETGNEYHPDD